MITEDIEISFLPNTGLMIWWVFFFYFDMYASYKLRIHLLYGNSIADL